MRPIPYLATALAIGTAALLAPSASAISDGVPDADHPYVGAVLTQFAPDDLSMARNQRRDLPEVRAFLDDFVPVP